MSRRLVLDAAALLISLLLLFGFAGAQVAPASGNGTIPSATSLARCPKSCGDLTFDYPFGIGAGCFRDPSFELICNDTMQPPRLFLRDDDTEVIQGINPSSAGSDLRVDFSRTIPMRSGVDVYNISWKVPGRSFTGTANVHIKFTGCDFDAYWNDDVHSRALICTVTCPSEGITDTDASQHCNGTGCCNLMFSYSVVSLDLQFVRHDRSKGNLQAETQKTNQSSSWDRIQVDTDYMWLSWGIPLDKSSCSAASKNKTNYACVNEYSTCRVNEYAILPSYYCVCADGYVGNPYLTDGCSRDQEYNPLPQRVNCSRSCGNISVPFPFGLEEGCSARKQFLLDCSDMTSSMLQIYDLHVSYINIDEGIMGTKSMSPPYIIGIYDPLYSGSTVTQDLHWAVANLSCQEAQQNVTSYACVSSNSTCLGLNSTVNYDGYYPYLGYICQCMTGFHGNPYVPNGCQDVDECKTTPGICRGLCNNTIGGFYCTDCPHKTEYDTTKMQCIPDKKQRSLMLGIMVGLGIGFGIPILGSCAVFVVQRLRRDVQKKQRRKYFRENKGILLEQLLSSDENASDKTKIFSLEDLQNATNNFHQTRILGRGGHGTVYKGILSDQRVVAIKMSKVIEQSEINQFINEVAILSQINHRNIVRLFGCCLETKVPLLVYDFVPNGSLYEILHSGSDRNFTLSWGDCLRIATEVAGALCYLHSAALISVFHRDVKSSNILLDANYTAKVSDFGASRVVPIDQTHIDTLVQGTFGYLDPEYYHTGQLNEKSDVYSFGVVLVELLLRRKPIFTNESGLKQNLSSYFLSELRSRTIKEIVAPQIREEANEEEICRVATLAEMCLKLRGDERPTMKQVEMALHTLQTKRSTSCIIAPEYYQDVHPLLYPRAQTITAHSSAADIGHNPEQQSQGFNSLEQEFLASAELPR